MLWKEDLEEKASCGFWRCLTKEKRRGAGESGRCESLGLTFRTRLDFFCFLFPSFTLYFYYRSLLIHVDHTFVLSSSHPSFSSFVASVMLIRSRSRKSGEATHQIDRAGAAKKRWGSPSSLYYHSPSIGPTSPKGSA